MSSMTSISYIPEDIVTDILLRLSSKSLVRFRCVCQSWRDLIASSSFTRSHINRNVATRSNRYLYAYHQSTIDEAAEHGQHSLLSFETFEPCLNLRHPLWDEKQFIVYGLSNGLLCISDGKLLPNSRIYIWNPSIRKYRTLPKLETHWFLDGNPTFLSFGFNPERNDYIVVRIVHSCLSPEVDVYTLSTNSWKNIRVTPPWSDSINTCCGSAFLNGVVYWTASTAFEYKIVAFDTGSEEFHELMVQTNEKFTLLLLLQVYEESLCLFLYYWISRTISSDIELWMMQEQSLNKVGTIPVGKGEDYFPFGSSIDNELLLAHMYRDEHGVAFNQMVLYNLDAKQFGRTGIRLKRQQHDGDFDCGAYIESLVLLSD